MLDAREPKTLRGESGIAELFAEVQRALLRGRYRDDAKVCYAVALPVPASGVILCEGSHLPHEIGFTSLIFAFTRADDFQKEIRRVCPFGLSSIYKPEERVGIYGQPTSPFRAKSRNTDCAVPNKENKNSKSRSTSPTDNPTRSFKARSIS